MQEHHSHLDHLLFILVDTRESLSGFADLGLLASRRCIGFTFQTEALVLEIRRVQTAAGSHLQLLSCWKELEAGTQRASFSNELAVCGC